jgi:hypothetical protein
MGRKMFDKFTSPKEPVVISAVPEKIYEDLKLVEITLIPYEKRVPQIMAQFQAYNDTTQEEHSKVKFRFSIKNLWDEINRVPRFKTVLKEFGKVIYLLFCENVLIERIEKEDDPTKKALLIEKLNTVRNLLEIS